MNAGIHKLLTLQKFDLALIKTKSRLADIPLEIDLVRDKIKAARKIFEQAEDVQKRMEADRLALRTERFAAEDKILKYKNQLLSVKKNDEYQAMLSQIEGVKNEVSQIEEKEIELLYGIDGQVKTVAEKLKEFEAERALFEGQIELKNAERIECEGRLAAAQKDVDAARAEVPEAYIEAYDRLKKAGKRMPVLVAIQAEKCDGCHLGLSKMLVGEAVTAEVPVFCEQCGRMVYAG